MNAIFRVSILLKGLDGALEIVGGIALLFIAPHSIQELARWAVAHDLAGSPHDFLARHLLNSANDLSASTTLFGAIYLLSHGIAKVVLVVLLLREKLWAYPWMIALLIAFIVYQIYRFTYRPGPGLVVLTLFDAFVAWLTWLEYTERKAAKRSATLSPQGLPADGPNTRPAGWCAPPGIPTRRGRAHRPKR